MAAPEEIGLLRQTAPSQRRLARKQFAAATAAKTLVLVTLAAAVYLWWIILTGRSLTPPKSEIPSRNSQSSRLQQHVDCAIQTLKQDTNLDFLRDAHPLPASEFLERRDRLAQALDIEGLDAFVVEPGYTFSYYANVTQPDWEVWEPEERPFLMVIRPIKDDNGHIEANTSFLVPSFEAERARLLGMPSEEPIQLITYEEHWQPYETLLNSDVFEKQHTLSRQPKIMVDEETRDFISRGLSTAGFSVHGLSSAPEQVRQLKSPRELDILRAINTGTVESLRAARTCLTSGLTEQDVKYILDSTLRSAGMEPFFNIVLFDENASNPHGGTNGSKILEKETMVLIDVGAHLYGYSSDICRSFFPPFFPQPEAGQEDGLSDGVKKKLEVWDVVFEAQTAALEALYANNTAAAVDLAARGAIEYAGYGEAFTHRVGHGIGIKAHESPYLHKGNAQTLLREGMVFTAEPGVYLVDEFGVRHEDVLLVREKGLPDVLSGKRAVSAWKP